MLHPSGPGWLQVISFVSLLIVSILSVSGVILRSGEHLLFSGPVNCFWRSLFDSSRFIGFPPSLLD